MKMKNLKKSKLLTLVASVLVFSGGVAIAVVSEQNIGQIDNKIDGMFERYKYEQVDKNLKTEKLLALSEQFKNEEITSEQYILESASVEGIEKEKFVQEYFKKEDAQEYEDLNSERAVWKNVGTTLGTIATVAGGAGAIFSWPPTEKEK